MDCVRDILLQWGPAKHLAREIGVDSTVIRQWKARGRVPARYWLAIVEIADRQGIGCVTLERLAELHAGRLPGREQRAHDSLSVPP